MSQEIKQFLDESNAMGRINAQVEAIGGCLKKGLKRSAPERRALWDAIATQAMACRDAIPLGAKARAPKTAKIVAAQIAVLNDMKQ